MPIVKVGEQRIKFPDSMSQDQIAAALQSQLQEPAAIGRPARAAQLQTEREQEREAFLSTLDPLKRSLIEETSPFQTIGVGVAQKAIDLAGLVGIGGDQDPVVREAIAVLEKANPEAFGTGEVLAETAAFLPGGLAAGAIKGLAPRVAATTVLGGAEGAAIAATEDRDVGTGTILGGAVAGAVELGIPIIGKFGGAAIRRMTGKAPKGAVIDAQGNPSQEFIEALERSGQTFDDVVAETQKELAREVVDPEQAARKAFLEAQGLTGEAAPTRAQITRSVDDFKVQQEAVKSSGRIEARLAAQDRVLSSRFDNSVLETGGDAITPTSSVSEALVSKASSLDKEISALYKTARERGSGLNLPSANSIISQPSSDSLRLNSENALLVGNIDNNILTIESSGIKDATKRGTGEGVGIYSDAINHAKNIGLSSVKSDNVVSESASRVWESLRKRGVPVRKNPNARLAVPERGEPFLTVDGADDLPVYTLDIESIGDVKNIKFNRLTAKLRKLAPSNRRSGGNIEAVVGDLQSKGVLDADMNVVGKIDIDTAEDVRQLMNELFDPQNGFGNSVLRQLKDELDKDVFKAAGNDVFQAARKAKFDFEQGLSRAKISKFDSRKKNIVRDILENKDSVDPERLTEKVVFGKGWRASDLQQMKDYLSDTDAGLAAFNDLRAETLQMIKDRSFIGPEDASGFRSLSRDKLDKSIKSIGEEKLKVLFSAEERKFLNDMSKVAGLREPRKGIQQGLGPSSQAVLRIEKKLANLPVIGGVFGFLDIDASGRLATRARPQRVVDAAEPSRITRAVTRATSPIALGASAAAAQEE